MSGRNLSWHTDRGCATLRSLSVASPTDELNERVPGTEPEVTSLMNPPLPALPFGQETVQKIDGDGPTLRCRPRQTHFHGPVSIFVTKGPIWTQTEGWRYAIAIVSR